MISGTVQSESAKARVAAAKATSGSTQQSKLRESARKDTEAESAGKEAGRWQTKAAGYMKDKVCFDDEAGKTLNVPNGKLPNVSEKRDQQQADRRVHCRADGAGGASRRLGVRGR